MLDDLGQDPNIPERELERLDMMAEAECCENIKFETNDIESKRTYLAVRMYPLPVHSGFHMRLTYPDSKLRLLERATAMGFTNMKQCVL